MRWPLLGIAWGYIVVGRDPAAPGALLLTSFERFATVICRSCNFTLDELRTGSDRWARLVPHCQQPDPGFCIDDRRCCHRRAAWIIYRSRMPGRGAAEYVIMFPQAVPRLVFGLGLMWAWIILPLPIYGTLWLLGIAYSPSSCRSGAHHRQRSAAGRPKSLEECARRLRRGVGL